MKPKDIQKWEETRKLGPWKYAFLYGSVWALFVVGFMFILNSFFKFDQRIFHLSGLLFFLAVYWITGIILYRFIIWRAKEKIYEAWKNNS